MAYKQPTRDQIAALVGGKPLSFAFNPATGDLCVIAPSGQKRRFTPKDWESKPKTQSKPAPKSPSTKKKAPAKPKSK